MLERIGTLFLVFVICITTMSFIYYELSYSPSDIGIEGYKSSVASSHLSNADQFFILNQTLSSLNAELKHVYSHQQEPSSHNDAQAKVDGLMSLSPVDIIPTVTQLSVKKMSRKTALLYTMDSISAYESASKRGGAAGEILIRHSLETIFKELNVELDVKGSDAEFEATDTSSYDFIIVDPWTWAAKGWVPKKHLIGMDDKMYILNFFGAKKLRGSGLHISPSRFLTAYDTNSYNTFLGFFMRERDGKLSKKKIQGIMWGKDIKHFEGKSEVLKSVADKVLLLSSATSKVFDHRNVRWLGHQSSENWMSLLSESRFLLGLGDPLLGPSAMDAISVGCMYINPIYDTPLIVNEQLFHSQHPYALSKIGAPYVCSYRASNFTGLQDCIDIALRTELRPFIPQEFTKEAYRKRVIRIFNL